MHAPMMLWPTRMHACLMQHNPVEVALVHALVSAVHICAPDLPPGQVKVVTPHR